MRISIATEDLGTGILGGGGFIFLFIGLVKATIERFKNK